jgi:hypothetical protein
MINETDFSTMVKTAKELVDTFGVDAQVFVCMEELAECISILCRAKRSNRTVELAEIQSEVVDALLMSLCMAYAFDVTPDNVQWKIQKAMGFVKKAKQ